MKEQLITEAILHMVTHDLQPLSFVEDKGFRGLMKVTVPLYSVPSRKTLTTLLHYKYEELALKLKTSLSEVPSFTLTTDIWTDNSNQSYIGTTIHYLDGINIMNCTLGLKPMSESHTSDYISDNFVELCEEWSINKEKIHVVLADSAANITRAIENTFGKGKHQPCFAHTLALVPTRAISETQAVGDLITNVKLIVRFTRQSVNASDMLASEQRKKGVPEGDILKLLQEVPTRWNSTFYMLERFLKLREVISGVLINFPTAPQMPTAQQICIAEDILSLLRPLEKATKDISGELYITSSRVIPLVRMITLKTEDAKPSTEVGKLFKINMLKELQKRFHRIEERSILAIATLLDARFKRMHFSDIQAVSRALNMVNTYFILCIYYFL